MTQYDFGTIDTANTDGDELATLLETYRDAVNSNHAGASRPSYAVANMLWLDTSSVPYVLKYYDGTQDIVVGFLNATDKYSSFRSRQIMSSKSANYSAVVDTDHGTTFSIDASGGARALTLPLASLAKPGYEVTVIKTDSSSNAVTLIRSSSDTINEFGYTSMVLADQGEWATLVCDGVSKWKLVSRGGNDVQTSEAEDGTKTGARFWSPARVRSAVRKISGEETIAEGSVVGMSSLAIGSLNAYRTVEIEMDGLLFQNSSLFMARISDDGITYKTDNFYDTVFSSMRYTSNGLNGDELISYANSNWVLTAYNLNPTTTTTHQGYSGKLTLNNLHGTQTPGGYGFCNYAYGALSWIKGSFAWTYHGTRPTDVNYIIFLMSGGGVFTDGYYRARGWRI